MIKSLWKICENSHLLPRVLLNQNCLNFSSQQAKAFFISLSCLRSNLNAQNLVSWSRPIISNMYEQENRLYGSFAEPSTWWFCSPNRYVMMLDIFWNVLSTESNLPFFFLDFLGYCSEEDDLLTPECWPSSFERSGPSSPSSSDSSISMCKFCGRRPPDVVAMKPVAIHFEYTFLYNSKFGSPSLIIFYVFLHP